MLKIIPAILFLSSLQIFASDYSQLVNSLSADFWEELASHPKTHESISVTNSTSGKISVLVASLISDDDYQCDELQTYDNQHIRLFRLNSSFTELIKFPTAARIAVIVTTDINGEAVEMYRKILSNSGNVVNILKKHVSKAMGEFY